MKPNSSLEKVRSALPFRSKQRGFALVISLSLMVLLTVLAVGLLTLSSLSLRASSQSEAMEVAKSNARMALSLAIGQLQKSAGQDQRITAPATFQENEAPANLTGVWKGSLPTAAEPAPDKESNFLGYLVSGNEGASNPKNLPNLQSAPILLGEGSLGKQASPNDFVKAPTVETMGEDTGMSGRYAWSVLDEGTKAKVDLTREENLFGNASAQAAMGSPSRFGLEGIKELEEYDWFEGKEQRKLFTIPTSALIDKMPELKEFQHEVTTVHRGLATDSARGGLKKDLSLLFGGTSLPSEFAGQRIYDDPSVKTDIPNPFWAQLFEYSNQYRSLTGTNPTVKAAVPSTSSNKYEAYKMNFRTRTEKATPASPEGLLLMPVVAKVQMQFSMVVKEAHGPWAGGVDKNASTAADNYMVYMIYSPIVTLYNPYNIPLTFDELRIEFEDLPLGFRFYRNGMPQTTTMAHMNQLYVDFDQNSGQKKKAFGINLRNSYTASRTTPVILQPGENRVFGESVDGNWSWANNQSSFFDYQNASMTTNMPLAPGYPSQGVGFWIDWLTPDNLKQVNDGWGVFPTSLLDKIDVGIAPMTSQGSANRVFMKLNLLKGGQTLKAGALELEYVNQTKLRQALSRDPNADFQAGEVRLERPYEGREMLQYPGDKLKDYTRAKAFAQFSFYGKTTLEADVPSKPWVQGGQSSSLIGIDLAKESMGIHPFEVSLKRLGPSYKFPCDTRNRGKFFTAHSDSLGIQIAPQYEIPLLPVQSLAQLRHAGLCNQGFLPGTTYTVGESFASPMIDSNEVAATGTKDYRLLDHAWLANNTLWDAYYFSTIAPHAGPLLDAKSVGNVAEDFITGEKPLLNTRYVPAGNGATSEVVSELTDTDGYLKSAAHLMIDGAFNVNSTSVNAWIALLSSLNQETVEYWNLAPGAAAAARGQVEGAKFPFSRMRRAIGPPIENSNPLDVQARWNGMRSLDQDQIEELAAHLVEEVKERGPFLSLAEFVNRRPGSNRKFALEGPIQTAIDETTKINQRFDADSVIITSDKIAQENYAFPDAILGKSATGAPGFLTQGDVLTAIGSVISVRSDTFRVRGYGEALNPDKSIAARAWCEAVVQRTPDFVDPKNKASDSIDSLSDANKHFGRRFEVTSFRWLGPEEV